MKYSNRDWIFKKWSRYILDPYLGFQFLYLFSQEVGAELPGIKNFFGISNKKTKNLNQNVWKSSPRSQDFLVSLSIFTRVGAGLPGIKITRKMFYTAFALV